MKPKRILIITSGGGHLDNVAVILPAFEGAHTELMTYRHESTENIESLNVSKIYRVVLWAEKTGFLLGLSLLVNAFQFIRILIRSRPDIIFSTGSEIAILPFIISSLVPGIQRIHLETTTSASRLSLSGRILLRFCDRFFVQWPEMAVKYGPKARYAGRIY
jgi:beta-1,4-N-acetylglucosaminyltransferase